MSTDPLPGKFATFRASTAPAMTGPGGAHARATVRRQRRRAAVVGAVAAVLVLVGAGAALAGLGHRSERLTPVTAPTTQRPTPTPSQEDTSWQLAIRNARMDLRPETNANCGGPVVDFRDGHGAGSYRGYDLNYRVMDFNLFRADIDRDGRPDYLVTVGCYSGEDPERAECPTELSDEACEAQQKLAITTQLFVLRGTPERLTAIAGIHAGSYGLPPSAVTISDDGVITIVTHGGTPQYTYRWGYRNGRMAIVARVSVSPSPRPTGSASPTR